MKTETRIFDLQKSNFADTEEYIKNSLAKILDNYSSSSIKFINTSINTDGLYVVMVCISD